MIDEIRALKLINDVARTANALNSAKQEALDAQQKVSDAERAVVLAKTALNQFLGLV